MWGLFSSCRLLSGLILWWTVEGDSRFVCMSQDGFYGEHSGEHWPVSMGWAALRLIQITSGDGVNIEQPLEQESHKKFPSFVTTWLHSVLVGNSQGRSLTSSISSF